MAGRTARAPYEFGVFGPDHPEADRARALELEVFAEVFGNDAPLLAAEYAPYEAASTFLTAVDPDHDRVVGVIRLIVNSDAGLKSLRDMEREPWGRPVGEVLEATGLNLNPADTFDVATLAVAQGYRVGLVSLALYRSLCMLASKLDIRWLVAILDMRVYTQMNRRLHAPFQPYEGIGAASYLDSPASLPVWGNVPSYRSMLEATDPSMFDALFGENGLGDAVVPPDWDEAARMMATTRAELTHQLR